ncbi:MAG: nucleotidyltransferase domain-containing protein [Armatimonadetes bacterium]|nr:nucleotidyltransferase domain-containing protein [Armatimonadota bacterium]
MDRNDIIATITNHLSGREEVVFAYLHGSFQKRGLFRDIDIAVFSNPGKDLTYELELGVALERLVKRPVDVRLLNHATLAFRFHATRGIVLLSRDEELRDSFVERTRDQYYDFQPVARKHLKEVLLG